MIVEISRNTPHFKAPLETLSTLMASATTYYVAWPCQHVLRSEAQWYKGLLEEVADEHRGSVLGNTAEGEHSSFYWHTSLAESSFRISPHCVENAVPDIAFAT